MAAMVCGICGGSGSGKSTFTAHLTAALGTDEVSVLSFDAYYRDQSHMTLAERKLCNYDDPSALDHELFSHHLDELRHGRDIQVPIYDFANHTLSGRSTPLAARPTVIVEGILLLAFDEIATRLDFCVFLDIPENVRLARRLQRDVAERGREPDDVRRQFAETVAPMHELYVQPFRDGANRVVSLGEPYQEAAADVAAHLASIRVG